MHKKYRRVMNRGTVVNYSVLHFILLNLTVITDSGLLLHFVLHKLFDELKLCF